MPGYLAVFILLYILCIGLTYCKSNQDIILGLHCNALAVGKPKIFFRIFYSAPQCSHCKRCTSYSNSGRLSVCLSVCLSVTRRYCVKTTACNVARCSLHCQIAKCVLFCRNQKYSPGMTPSSEILAQTDPPSPKSSEF